MKKKFSLKDKNIGAIGEVIWFSWYFNKEPNGQIDFPPRKKLLWKSPALLGSALAFDRVFCMEIMHFQPY